MNQFNAGLFLSILALSAACKSETSDPSSARSSTAVSPSNSNHNGSPVQGSTGTAVAPASADATQQANSAANPAAPSAQAAMPAPPAAPAPASPAGSSQNCTPAVSVHNGQCDFDASWSDIASMCAALPGTIPASGCASQQLTSIQSSCCQAGSSTAATGASPSAPSQPSPGGGQGNLYWTVNCANGSNYNHGPFATLQALCADMNNNASHCPAEFQIAYKAQGCP